MVVVVVAVLQFQPVSQHHSVAAYQSNKILIY